MTEKSIDTSTIENYENMTAEEKVAALESFKYNDTSDDLATAQEQMKKLKDATDKATHSAADYKKQLEALKQQSSGSNSEVETLKTQIAELTKINTLTSLKATRLSLGYTEELASQYAEAQLDNDYTKVAEIERQFLEEKEKAFKAEALKTSPKPGQGGTGTPPTKTVTKEQFNKMTTQEQIAYKTEHPDDWSKFTS